jgi:curved DNA-binding protein CbpA
VVGRAVNHFEILGVPLDATQEQVAAAYRVRARQLHPDTKPDATPAERARLTEAMAQLNEAWSVLRDPGSRAEYRQRLEQGAPDEEEILVRVPADDECVMCGSYPATVLKFQHHR